MRHDDVSPYILSKIPEGGELRPSELFGVARSEGVPHTEQDMRRRIWTMVCAGVLDLTPKTRLRRREDAT